MSKRRKPPTVTIRLEKELAKDLRIVSAAADEEMPDYLGKLLRPILAKEMKKLATKLNQATEDESA